MTKRLDQLSLQCPTGLSEVRSNTSAEIRRLGTLPKTPATYDCRSSYTDLNVFHRPWR